VDLPWSEGGTKGRHGPEACKVRAERLIRSQNSRSDDDCPSGSDVTETLSSRGLHKVREARGCVLLYRNMSMLFRIHVLDLRRRGRPIRPLAKVVRQWASLNAVQDRADAHRFHGGAGPTRGMESRELDRDPPPATKPSGRSGCLSSGQRTQPKVKMDKPLDILPIGFCFSFSFAHRSVRLLPVGPETRWSALLGVGFRATTTRLRLPWRRGWQDTHRRRLKRQEKRPPNL
jgi:hypothetical protein